jgi:methionyl-tRNA formyltransferase
MRKSAVVFAYHNIGVSCLKVLLESELEIKLVITHFDNPRENLWFSSVADFCIKNKINFKKVEKVSDETFISSIEKINPDFIFSFYFRFMLDERVLAAAKSGAFNMHGSLLPKYRGRVPINWAIIKGEVETGATLHLMEKKPDAGDIVAQKSVEILPNETAIEVFNKVTEVAIQIMEESIAHLIRGDFPRIKNNLSKGSYFGGRKPEDGKIDLNQPTRVIYNLIRALAPPYPGAYIELKNGQNFFIYKSTYVDDRNLDNERCVFERNSRYYLQVEKNKAIEILTCGWAEQPEVAAPQFFKQSDAVLNLALPWRFD